MTRLTTLLASVLVWGLAGALFGGLYGGLTGTFALTTELDSPYLRLILTTAISSAVTAAFFGSMLVALFGAMIGVLSAIAYLLTLPLGGGPWLLAVAAFAIAFFAGRLLPDAEGLRMRPLGQTVSGLLAGILTGPVLLLIGTLVDLELRSSLGAGIAVAAVGILFLVLSRLVTRACPDWLSAGFGGPIVSGIIATAIALGVWLMGSTIGGGPSQVTLTDIETITAAIPAGLLGGAVGGTLGGFGISLLGLDRGMRGL